ncbi:MAG: dihydrodipicolinate synthase family protein [Candidatus Babeliales bacterium]
MKKNLEKAISIQSDNVIVPLITPTNIEDFFPLVDHVLSGGIKNLMLFGTTGEGNKFDLEIKKAIIKKLVTFIGTQAKLFTVLFGSSLIDIVNFANFCEDAGFKAALIPITQTNDRQFFSQLLEKTNIKFFLYNTASAPTMEIRDDLFNSNRIIGLKDSSGNIEFVKNLINKYKETEFKIYYGREHQIEKALTLDIDGIFPGIGNIQPDLAVKLWEKRDEETFALFRDLKKQIDNASPGNYQQGIRNLLAKKGIIR